MKKGDKIRILRTMKGLSQENMAEMMGMSRLAYGDIERNKVAISTGRLEKIAKILGIAEGDIDAKMNSIANFFDKCNSPQVNAGSNNTIHNNFDQKDLLHKIELLQLKLEKVEVEMRYWKEKFDLLNNKI